MKSRLMQEKSKKRFLLPAGLAILFLVGLVAFWPSLLSSTFADSSTSLAVDPWIQLPGGSVYLKGDGFEPDSNVTITVKNVIATVETQEKGESASVTRPDSIVAAKTTANSDGTLEYALGIPRDEVKVIERWISNSTGQDDVLKTVTTTYRFQGTVKVIATDQLGNTASAEITVLQWIDRSPY